MTIKLSFRRGLSEGLCFSHFAAPQSDATSLKPGTWYSAVANGKQRKARSADREPHDHYG